MTRSAKGLRNHASRVISTALFNDANGRGVKLASYLKEVANGGL